MLVWETDPQLLFKCLIYPSMKYNVDSQGCDLITILDIQVKKSGQTLRSQQISVVLL